MLVKTRRIITCIASILLIFTMSVSVFALENEIDLDRIGSLSITLNARANNEVIKAARFTVYKVADAFVRTNNLEFEYTDDFKANAEDLDDLNAEGLAQDLLSYATAKQIRGRTADASEDGTVVFAKLSSGLYLVTQEGKIDGYHSTSPFLVTIPLYNSENGWIYDVEALPKVEEAVSGITPTTPPTTTKPQPTDPLATTEVDSTEEDEDELIQTGQLNWPVPVLAGLGLALFAYGWATLFLKKKEDQ